MIVEMAAVDAGIGDEEALRAEPEPDALGDAGKLCGKRRPCGAVENPDRAETMPRRSSAASRIRLRPRLQLRSGIVEIHCFGDRRLCGKKFLGVARGRGQERHAAARRDADDDTKEGQVPDDITDARLDLDHSATSRISYHIASRAEGCDMRFYSAQCR